MKKTKWKILPPKPDHCQICAKKHDPEIPHDKNSLYYQMCFENEHGRWPTWADAMAHCSDDVKEQTKEVLKKHGIKV